MKKTTTYIFLIISVCAVFSSCHKQLTDYVNPFVGTDGHGHTTPAAILPFGQIQVGPDTRLEGWDGCSGYHYSDDTIYGFSHTHLSGTGVEDLCDIMIMPFGKDESNNVSSKWYKSHFSHNRESAEPGYYKVLLDNNHTLVELTLNDRCAYHRYVYSDGKENGFVLDLNHRDKLRGYHLTYDGKTIMGYRESDSWNPSQKCFFALGTDVSLEKVTFNEDSTMAICYWPNSTKKAQVYVSISSVDEMGALKHLMEYGYLDFDEVRKSSSNRWNQELGKIIVEGGDKEKKIVFYTSLYHCMTAPYVFNDMDGRYRGQDGMIHSCDSGRTMYTVFSLWDTYRAFHPLMTLIDSTRTQNWIYSMLNHYEQGGELTMWELWANETHCMIGYHAAPVILEALQHGVISNWSEEQKNKLLEAMIATANLPILGRQDYARDGYLSSEYDNESISKTLEYAYDDWCIAQYSKLIGNDSISDIYFKRSQSWKNVIDENCFMHPKRNSGWLTPFDPAEVNNHYTEANSWQYSSYVPQDIYGWIEKVGGADKAELFLDSLFNTVSTTTGRTQVDITGLIGLYAHGNEPSHHAAYLYAYLNKPDKLQRLIDRICTEMYSSKPDGLCGNEDCGQMSAWYVMSAMGLYPVCPGSGEYVIVKPQFSKVIVNGDANSFVIDSKTWPCGKFATYHNGTFTFNDKSSVVLDAAKKITITPTFSDWNPSCEVLTIQSADKVYYTINGKDPDTNSLRYVDSIVAHTDMLIKAIAYNSQTGYSKVANHQVRKFIQDKSLEYIIKPADQYSEGGSNLLIDRQQGTSNYKLGGWQGWQTDMEVIVDLQKEKYVRQVRIGYLSDTRSWIFPPKQVEVDSKVVSVTCDTDNIRAEVIVPINKTLQKLPIKVSNFGKMPEWHVSAGEQAWVFVDEITIE